MADKQQEPTPRPPRRREIEKIIDWLADRRIGDGREARRRVEKSSIAVFDRANVDGAVGRFAVVLWDNGYAEPWKISEVARPYTEAPDSP